MRNIHFNQERTCWTSCLLQISNTISHHSAKAYYKTAKGFDESDTFASGSEGQERLFLFAQF
jgi:hypothetical protein